MSRPYLSAALFLFLAGFLTTFKAIADDEVFALSEISVEGRVVSAAFADFDGDDRKDLMIASLSGMPPEETRAIRIHLQNPEGSYSESPNRVIDIPESSAVYDIADIKNTPGDELILLRPDAITILSIAGPDVIEWNVSVDGPSTVAAADDERGFDSFKLVYDIGSTPLLLVPQIGMVSVLNGEGESKGQIDVGGRANFFVSRKSSIFSAESDLQLYLDTPKLSIGDVNGDARTDIVAATRHEIRVFLGKADNQFDRDPSYTLALSLINPQDHSRGSGSVVTIARDINNDNLLDLVITHTEGTFSDTVTTTYIYRNRDGGWDLENYDDKFDSDGTVSSDLLLDIDGDNVHELVRVQFKFSVLEVVEILLTRNVDAVVEVHRQSDGHFDKKPSSRRKFSAGFSFDTFRPKGFMPQTGVDINADGFMDVVTSANGKAIEIYLGTKDKPFTKRTARQNMTTTGRIHFADFDNDNLLDFVLYDSQSFDAPVQIGRNRGELPDLATGDND